MKIEHLKSQKVNNEVTAPELSFQFITCFKSADWLDNKMNKSKVYKVIIIFIGFLMLER